MRHLIPSIKSPRAFLTPKHPVQGTAARQDAVVTVGRKLSRPEPGSRHEPSLLEAQPVRSPIGDLTAIES